MDAGLRVRVVSARPLSDAAGRVLTGGAFVVLAVAIFILTVGNEERDSALAQPAGVRGVQAVAAGPKTRSPRANAPESGPARQQPVGRARGLQRGGQLPG